MHLKNSDQEGPLLWVSGLGQMMSELDLSHLWLESIFQLL